MSPTSGIFYPLSHDSRTSEICYLCYSVTSLIRCFCSTNLITCPPKIGPQLEAFALGRFGLTSPYLEIDLLGEKSNVASELVKLFQARQQLKMFFLPPGSSSSLVSN